MLPNAALPNTAPAPYVRHRPELTLLYQVIEHHLPEFTEHLRERGHFLPKFVFQEFHDYLKCGRLEHGFVRVKCTGCRNELMVAFSCKHRGFCPSCGGRRMVDTAAHLVDRVLPAIPIRHGYCPFPSLSLTPALRSAKHRLRPPIAPEFGRNHFQQKSCNIDTLISPSKER